MLTRSAIGPKSTECVFDILLRSKNISPHLTLGIHTFFLSESIVGRYGHVYEILDANRSAEAFLNAILKLKRNFHLIKIYYFWTFIHSFTHDHFALQRTKKNNISSGIINARHTFSIIHTKTPKLTSRSPSTKRQNWKRNSSTEKNLHAHHESEILGVWKVHTICPAVDHWNVKRVSRNDIITMSDVVRLIYAIMIKHWQWNVFPHEVYLFTFHFRTRCLLNLFIAYL